jgi:hypothetical protein
VVIGGKLITQIPPDWSIGPDGEYQFEVTRDPNQPFEFGINVSGSAAQLYLPRQPKPIIVKERGFPDVVASGGNGHGEAKFHAEPTADSVFQLGSLDVKGTPDRPGTSATFDIILFTETMISLLLRAQNPDRNNGAGGTFGIKVNEIRPAT